LLIEGVAQLIAKCLFVGYWVVTGNGDYLAFF
jgi:hypothetical protein